MKINSLKFNNSTVHKMYHGNELVNKIGDAFTYMEASGDTPTPPTPVPYDEQYLTFVAEEDNLSIGLTNAGNNVYQYSIDDGATWNNLANNASTTSVNSGQTIMFKASGLTVDTNNGIGTLTPSVSARVEGNIMSLKYGDNFIGQTTIENTNQFRTLFSNSYNLTSAENLILPATTLAGGCYYGMFSACNNLTTAPELPATTLAKSCYERMFRGCTSLATAPELSATTLADGCYRDMFNVCTSLTSAPALPATSLTSQCYYQMFRGCTSLATAPELSATTLAQYCYNQMFWGCINLTTAPELPATTLVTNCYRYMFAGCTSLNYIKCLATNISGYRCTGSWVDGVASSGTFVKAASMNDWTTSRDGIPSNWTIQNDDGSPVDNGRVD